MDILSASQATGWRWQLARFGALMFFALACALLAAALLNPSRAGVPGSEPAGLRSL
jgi:hypothetical protein